MDLMVLHNQDYQKVISQYKTLAQLQADMVDTVVLEFLMKDAGYRLTVTMCLGHPKSAGYKEYSQYIPVGVGYTLRELRDAIQPEVLKVEQYLKKAGFIYPENVSRTHRLKVLASEKHINVLFSVERIVPV